MSEKAKGDLLISVELHNKPKEEINSLDCKTVRIFAYSSKREQSNERSGTRLKTERACEARACKTLTPRFTDFLTDFEKKIDCFAVYKLMVPVVQKLDCAIHQINIYPLESGTGFHPLASD